MEENFKWLNKCVGFNGSGGDYIYIQSWKNAAILRVNFIPKNYSLRIIHNP